MFTRKINDELSLALVDPKLADRCFEIIDQNRDYLGKYLPWALTTSSKYDHLAFIKHSLMEYANGNGMACYIIYKNDIAGSVSFNNINHNLKKVVIGYWLRQDLQGNGIMTQAVQKMIDIAFNELDMTKIEISTATENKPSRAICERLGFTLEGVITQNNYINGKIVDSAIYGLQKPSKPSKSKKSK